MYGSSHEDSQLINRPDVLYYYNCDGSTFSDVGWGCVYRMLQTLYTQVLGMPAPSLSHIQRTLAVSYTPMDSKQMWIEPVDIIRFFDASGVAVPQKLFLYFPNPADVVSQRTQMLMRRTSLQDAHCVYFNGEKLLSDLKETFRKHRYLVIIDNGVMSYGIFGFRGCKLLVLDPHTTAEGRVVQEMDVSQFLRQFWMVLSTG